MDAAYLAKLTQIHEYSGATIHAATGHMRLPDELQQALIFVIPIRKWLLQPLVVTAPSGPQKAEELLYRPTVLVLQNERVLHPCSLEKDAAAFFGCLGLPVLASAPL